VPEQRGVVLASDAERERAALLLRDAAAEGRLTLEELSDRVASAYSARTSTDLDGLVRDLPALAAVTPVPERRRPTRWVIAVMSGARRKGRWRPGDRCAAVAVMGGCKLDLRDAEISGQQIQITAVAVMGGVTIIVPEGIEVEVSGLSVMGGKNVKVADVPPRPGMPEIHVRALAVMGGVEVRSKPVRRLKPARRSAIAEVEVRASSERRSLRPASAPDGTVTILFSDIEASTELNARLGDVRWLELLRAHHAIVRRELRQHGAFEVKAQGDGFMIALPSARRAAQCALAIQRAIEEELGDHADGPIRVRIGMHTGEAIREDEDLYGRNVSVAARIAEHAGAGEVLASAVVKQLAESGGDISFENERVLALKGLGDQVVYTVVARSRE
jgi:class 3 adenylate cyclase